MPATPVYGLRYPALADPADVPSDMQKLASDVEAALTGTTLTGPYNARPAANAVKAGTVYYATDTYGVWRSDGAAWLLTGQGSPIIQPFTLSNPPFSTPYNGQRVTVQVDGSKGITWGFVYNATDGYWDFTGGAPLEATAGDTVGLAGGWQRLEPTVVAPRNGEYVAEAAVYYLSGGGGNYAVGPGLVGATGPFNNAGNASGMPSGAVALAPTRSSTVGLNAGQGAGFFIYAAGSQLAVSVQARSVGLWPIRLAPG